MYYNVTILNTDSGIFHMKENLPTIQAAVGYLEGYMKTPLNADSIDTELSCQDSIMFLGARFCACQIVRIDFDSPDA